MSQPKIIISDRAVNSLRRVLDNIKSTSLVGAEEARVVIMNRIRKLSANPVADSRKANFITLEGEFRSVLAWNYRIYYKVHEKQVIVLDIFLDKD
ncbi:MAG: plasmid stabilization system protein ParE [Flavobacteriales bacterium]|jgi:plasmid stabilization system protein ParE